MMTYYPINLDITDRECVVVGGGTVALRKIRSLLGSEARVTVISPQVVAEIEELANKNKLTCCRRGYQRGDLENAFLAFAATDNPDVQKEVALEANEKGVFLNIVDDPDSCDFQIPATIRRGELLIAVSTGGNSPAISRMVRQELEDYFGLEYAALIFLFARIRERLIPGPTSSNENKKMFRELLLSNILGCVREGDWEEVEILLNKHLPDILTAEEFVLQLREFVADHEVIS